MKRTIFLGIGGTGNKAIAFAKKQYEAEFGVGNIPDSIAFIGFDFQTNMADDPRLATNIKSDFITVKSTANPREHYKVNSEAGMFKWMPTGNVRYIQEVIADGAGAVRTTGRLYAEMTLQTIMSKITEKINAIKNIRTSADMHPGININMVMSLAGGTGAGSFLTIAAAIKQAFGGDVKITGFGVSHGVFQAMDIEGNSMPNVVPNGISSIIDIDYLMTASPKNPIEIESGTEKITITDPIFENFFIVDNKSAEGFTIDNVDDLCEMLGLGLYSFGGKVGDDTAALLNNVGWNQTGQYDVKSKLGWVMGLGACQVVYKGEDLATIYSLNAAVELIRKMTQESNGVLSTVLPWIESVGLREDNNNEEKRPHDQLIDTIFDSQKIETLDLPALDQSQADVINKKESDSYIVSTPAFPTTNQLNALLASFEKQLEDKVQMLLSQNGAVGNALTFLQNLREYLDSYKTEMADEILSLTKDRNSLLKSFETAYDEYNAEKFGRLRLHHEEKNQSLLNEKVGAPAYEILKLLYQIKRRQEAEKIFNSLIVKIGVIVEGLNTLKSNLEGLKTQYEKSIVKMTTGQRVLEFEYDLSKTEREKMTVDAASINVDGFVNYLNGKNQSLLGSDDLSIDLLDYTISLPQAQEYKERLLSEVIQKLSDKDYKTLKSEIAKRSSRWLQINSRGQYTVKKKIVEDAIVKNLGVTYFAGGKAFRLKDDGDFIPTIAGKYKRFTEIDSSALRQRMIVTCIDGAIIPYCIASLEPKVLKEYDQTILLARTTSAFLPSFDCVLSEKMAKENFKLKPEMKGEEMFYWVCAQLFGTKVEGETIRLMEKESDGSTTREQSTSKVDHTKFVKFKKGHYWWWSFEDAEWFQLGDTVHRPTAYEVFRTDILPKYKEVFKKVILDSYQSKEAEWQSNIKRLFPKSEGGEGSKHDYIDLVVCANKNSATFRRDGGEEYKLLEKEYEYIRTQLLAQLALLRNS